MQQITRATRAILLARVSDVRQDSEDAQMSNIQRYAENLGFKRVDEIRIKESSTKGDRKRFQEIITEIKASREPVALVVDTIDRLQRTFRESVLLNDLRLEGKVELYFHRENLAINSESNSVDLMRWDMGVMFARNYVLQLGDNVKRKFKQMREEGKRTGPPELGYKAVYEMEGNKRKRIDIVPDPNTAPLIVECFTLFATGEYSVKTMTALMEKRGLIGRTGKTICTSKMHYTLSNPFYYGIMRSKYGDAPHIYAPLISEELFMKVQKILRARRKNPTKTDISNDYVFRGMIHCKHCGCLYSPEKKRGYLIYYSCTNAKRNCKREYIREEKLLEPVYEVLSRLQLPAEKIDELVKALRKNIESKSFYLVEERSRLRRIIDAEQKVIDGATIKFACGDIEKDVYDRVMASSREKQLSAEAELAKHTEADEGYFVNAERVLSVARRAKEIFESSEVAEKRRFLGFLLQNPTADGKNLEFTLKSPFKELVSMSDHPNELRD